MENNVTLKEQQVIDKNRIFDGRNDTYASQYNEEKDVAVHFVSRKKLKEKFKVGGVLDNEQSNNWKAWLYLAPVLILMAIFLIYPLINTIVISFLNDYNYITGDFDGFTFNNFGAILGLSDINGARDNRLMDYGLANTFILTFVTVPLSLAIALLIAVLLNSLKWFQKVYQIVFFLPYVTNTIAIGMVFSVLFDTSGIINYIFGTDITWIYGADRWVAMVPLCIYIIWSALPFKILILLSGLQGVDKQYYQAAKIDSTPKWRVLLRITVPALSPQILYLMVTSFIGAFKEYSSIVALFNGPGTSTGSYNMYTIVYYIYDNLNTKTSLAAAAAVILFVIILIFTFLQLWLSKKKVHY